MKHTPILSLFSGAGGMDLGFEWAGFRPRLAIDSDSAAEGTYTHNHPLVAFRRLDLTNATGERIADLWLDASPGEAPVGVVAGPPCQAFSVGNVRPKADDPRRFLPIRYALLLKNLNERFSLDFFVFENVTGLMSPRHRNYFVTLCSLFRLAGFNVWFGTLNAASFGVPQKRRRLFVVGLNAATYGSRRFTLAPFPSGVGNGRVVDAIGKLPDAALFHRGLMAEGIPLHPNHWTMFPRSSKFPDLGAHKNGRSFRRLTWTEPSWTISFGHREVYVHPGGHRRLSVLEAMLLQGFPVTYTLLGNLSQQFQLISDAVPPPMAFAVAWSVRAAIMDRTLRYEAETETALPS